MQYEGFKGAFDEVPLNDILGKLSVEEYKRLGREGFDFNQLKKKKIESDPYFVNSKFSCSQGKTTG